MILRHLGPQNPPDGCSPQPLATNHCPAFITIAPQKAHSNFPTRFPTIWMLLHVWKSNFPSFLLLHPDFKCYGQPGAPACTDPEASSKRGLWAQHAPSVVCTNVSNRGFHPTARFRSETGLFELLRNMRLAARAPKIAQAPSPAASIHLR